MKLNTRTTLIAAIASCTLAACGGGGGGGDDQQDVYQKASRDYACYNAAGALIENLNMSFSSESMQIRSNGQVVITAGNPSQTDGGYGYATALPSSQFIGLVMYPNGKEIAGQRYGVIYALTFPGTSTVNAFSSRLCK